MARVFGAAVFALALGACDAVRVPGDGQDVPAPNAPVDQEPAPVPPVDTEPLRPAPETDTAPDAETPPSETVPQDETAPDAAEVTPQPEPVSAPVTDLAAINAAICGLPIKPAEDTLTIAQLTGAQPPNADLVGVATINGTSASLSDFPGLVKMEPRETLPGGAIASGHCGATRIAPNWFVTAAHCLDDDYDEVVLVTAAENLQSPLAKRVQASASLCHRAYGGAGNNYVNDIALVRVDDSVLADITGIPIAAFGVTQTTLVPLNYDSAEMAGWGLTAFRGTLSNDLLSAKLSITSVGPAAINVESANGSGPCVGDSGGPLFLTEGDGTRTAVGVLSVVEQNTQTEQFCEGTYGARYTNLQGYADWIEETMAACDANSGLCGF